MCNWKPPEGLPDELRNWKCQHDPVQGREDGLCIFHIPLDEKNNNSSLAEEFRIEFIKLFRKGKCDFVGFEFPDDFRFGEEKEGACFELNFKEKIGLINQNKRKGEKTEKYRFDCAEFGKGTDFSGTIHGEGTSFQYANFGDRISFNHAEIGMRTNFQYANFGDKTSFNHAEIGMRTNFHNSNYGNQTSFEHAKFGIRTSFRNSRYGDMTSFEHAEFGSGISFSRVQFGKTTSFQDAVFKGELFIRKILGLKLAFNCNYEKRLNKDTNKHEYELYQATIPEIFFKNTKFEGPAHFYRCDLSKTIFQQVDLKNISFLQSEVKETKFISCKWGSGKEAKKYWRRKQRGWFRLTRPRLLFDELIWRKSQDRSLDIQLLRKYTYIIPGPDDTREVIERLGLKYRFDHSPGDIEALALQFKQSLESTKDPIAAGDFHFCFMEMKREQAIEEGRKGRAFALWLYKMANGYGERYGRTLMWLGWLVAIFTGLYAWNGDFVLAEWTCREVADALAKAKEVPAAGGFLEYLLFAFQNILPFKFGQPILNPCSLGAKALSFAETFIGSSLFAFFLLALRRRFKR